VSLRDDSATPPPTMHPRAPHPPFPLQQGSQPAPRRARTGAAPAPPRLVNHWRSPQVLHTPGPTVRGPARRQHYSRRPQPRPQGGAQGARLAWPLCTRALEVTATLERGVRYTPCIPYGPSLFFPAHLTSRPCFQMPHAAARPRPCRAAKAASSPGAGRDASLRGPRQAGAPPCPAPPRPASTANCGPFMLVQGRRSCLLGLCMCCFGWTPSAGIHLL
jgi:hypothetical protein